MNRAPITEPHPPPLTASQYLGYAGGDFANNLTFSMASMFLLLYYTDVVGIAAGAAGAILLGARLLQAVTDLVAGRIVDHTTTRWGRFRPYFVLAAVPLMLLGVAIFTVPGGLSPGATIAWAAASYALFGLLYSFVNIPYGAIAAAMTQLPVERARLSGARTIGAAVAIIGLSVVVAPLIETSPDLQHSLTIVMGVFAVLGTALYFFLYRTSREVVQRTTAPAGARETMAQLRRNRPLLMLCLSTLAVLTGLFVVQTLQVYYARDVLGSANYVIVLIIVSTGGMLLGAPMLPWIVRRVGKRTGYLVAGAVCAVGGVGIAVSPPSVPVLAIASFAVFGIGMAVVQALMWALQADTVEYGEWRTGARIEGVNYAALSFTRKVGQGIGGALAAWGIAVGGYVAGGTAQAPAALDTIRILTGAAPAVFVAVGAVLMIAYPLTEEKTARIVRELRERSAPRA